MELPKQRQPEQIDSYVAPIIFRLSALISTGTIKRTPDDIRAEAEKILRTTYSRDVQHVVNAIYNRPQE